MTVKVKLNLQAINRLMSSEPVQKVVNQEGERIAQRAGAGFEYVASPHRWTARGFVQATSAAAMRAEARDKTLTRAVGGSGGS